MERVLLNCDLGENETLERTKLLMSRIDAANICCGVHAGNQSKTEATIRFAAELEVKIGAHPGLDGAGGRGVVQIAPDGFRRLLEDQVHSFVELLEVGGYQLHHVKLHGSLYHEVEANQDFAAVYLDFLESLQGVAVFALAGGRFAAQAEATGIKVYQELFADRGYDSVGQLLPRGVPGALIQTVEEAADRIREWVKTGRMLSNEGVQMKFEAATVCVHGDSDHAEGLLAALQQIL